MLWLLVLSVVVMAPALVHGSALGPFDLLTRHGLTKQGPSLVHNGQATDLIAEMIPWTALSWTQVHAGHLPLWNPYSALGTPLAFNWQSAAFSLPALVGYALPERLDFTTQVLATLAIAGVGAYTFARVLRLGVIAAVVAGTVYELSGPMMGFLGWPIAGVMSWAGWIFAASVIVFRGRRRLGGIAFLAAAFALAVFAGQPGTLAVLLLGLLVFVVVVVVLTPPARTGRGLLRLGTDFGSSALLGFALSAPLLLPGAQLLSRSVFKDVQRVNQALPAQDAVNVLLQGFSGVPLARLGFFNVGTTAYVGVIAVVMAVAGFAVRRRRPEVAALGAVVVVSLAVSFLPPVAAVLNALPYRARWHVAMVVLALGLAVLAGVGTDALVRAPFDHRLRTWIAGGFGAAMLVLLELWFFGRGLLPREEGRIRDESFIWPLVSVAVGLLVVGALVRLERRHGRGGRFRFGAAVVGRGAGLALLACETAFLTSVGSQVFASSPTFFASPPAVVRLERAVGNAVVGFGARSCQAPPTLGILQEANDAYAVHEFAAYDPIAPRALFSSWRAASGNPANAGVPVSVFCPVVRAAAQAREFGVSFVLEPPGAPGPSGSVFVRTVGDESLYRFPGVSVATLVSDPGPGPPPAPGAAGVPVAVSHPDAATWRAEVDATSPGLLRLRLTDVPGWHGSIDGRPLRLEQFGGVMIEARIPPGRHTVELSYWPRSFTVGIALAAVGLAAIAVAGVALPFRHRRGASRRIPTSTRPAD